MAKLQSFKIGLQSAFLLCAILGLSCARPNAESAKVSMTLPSPQSMLAKASSQSVSATSDSDVYGYHLVINVTGEGASVYCFYDSKRKTTVGKCKFDYPTVTIMEVPTGKSRLFQVMYAVDSANGTTFNYGEAPADIQTEEATVNLKLAPLTGNGKSGHVHGRYASGTVAAPVYKTGTLLVRYKPSPKSPAMTLLEQEVFGGWFRTVSFGALPLSYEVNGEIAFDRTMTLENFESLIPISGDDIISYFENSSFERLMGWFGPGTNSANQMTLSTQTCYSSEYSTCLANGATGKSEFSGPFRSSGGTYSIVTANELRYQFLPGAETELDGLKMIVIPNGIAKDALTPYFIDDGLWDCDALAKAFPAGMRVSSAPSVAAATTTIVPSYSSFDMTTALAATDVAVICPYKGSRLYHSAVLYPDSFNSFDHGGYNGPYVHIELQNATSIPSTDVMLLTTGQCYRVSVGLYKGHGEQITHISAIAVNYSVESTKGSFFSDAGCATRVTEPTDNISASTQSTSSLYFKPLTAGDFSISITTESTLNMPPSSQKLSVSGTAP